MQFGVRRNYAVRVIDVVKATGLCCEVVRQRRVQRERIGPESANVWVRLRESGCCAADTRSGRRAEGATQPYGRRVVAMQGQGGREYNEGRGWEAAPSTEAESGADNAKEGMGESAMGTGSPRTLHRTRERGSGDAPNKPFCCRGVGVRSLFTRL